MNRCKIVHDTDKRSHLGEFPDHSCLEEMEEHSLRSWPQGMIPALPPPPPPFSPFESKWLQMSDSKAHLDVVERYRTGVLRFVHDSEEIPSVLLGLVKTICFIDRKRSAPIFHIKLERAQNWFRGEAALLLSPLLLIQNGPSSRAGGGGVGGLINFQGCLSAGTIRESKSQTRHKSIGLSGCIPFRVNRGEIEHSIVPNTGTFQG